MHEHGHSRQKKHDSHIKHIIANYLYTLRIYTQRVNAKLTKHYPILRDQRHRTGNQRRQHKTKSKNSWPHFFWQRYFPAASPQAANAQTRQGYGQVGDPQPLSSQRSGNTWDRVLPAHFTGQPAPGSALPNREARPGPGTGQMQQEAPGAATAFIPYSPLRRSAGEDLRLQAADGEPKGEAGERQCKALCHKGERRRLKGESSRRRAAAPAAPPAPHHSLLVAAIRFFPSFSNSLINLLVFSSSASCALTRSLNQGLSR